MKESLVEVIKTVPYNSFGPLILRKGETYPDLFGGNCVQQLRILDRKLSSEGYDADPIYLATRKDKKVIHYARICHEGGMDYFLDPFLLHLEPINLTKLFEKRDKETFEIYPVKGNSSSRITVQPTSKTRFKVVLYGINNGIIRPLRFYKYDLNETADFLPDEDSSEFLHLQKALIIRMLRFDNRLSWISLDSKTGNMDIATLDGEGNYQRISSRFNLELESIASELCCDSREILEHFSYGLSAYREFVG